MALIGKTGIDLTDGHARAQARQRFRKAYLNLKLMWGKTECLRKSSKEMKWGQTGNGRQMGESNVFRKAIDNVVSGSEKLFPGKPSDLRASRPLSKPLMEYRKTLLEAGRHFQ